MKPIQVVSAPDRTADLDLLKRLDAYANATAGWRENETPNDKEAKACRLLHASLIHLVDNALAKLMDQAGRPLETFTMHNAEHGRKVAHLMWQILSKEAQQRLTPPEIGMMIGAAFLHDAGMGLSPHERSERLAPNSPLWEELDFNFDVRQRLAALDERLNATTGSDEASQTQRRELAQRIAEAHESLLCIDARTKHATKQRYHEVLNRLRDASKKDRAIPDVDQCLQYDGRSFREMLVDICVSHNDPASSLVASVPSNKSERFPREYPVGGCTADTLKVAAALRLADILDFDRDRAPAMLFHYLLSDNATAEGDRSIIEWRKHMAIDHWLIDEHGVVMFRARCDSNLIHHAVKAFCEAIAQEINVTRGAMEELRAPWPFCLQGRVKEDITPEGYVFWETPFSLDTDRIFTLLMGQNLYPNPLDGVRELIQNAVDACKLLDGLLALQGLSVDASTPRITVSYIEPLVEGPHQTLPILRVSDTGTGMDKVQIEEWFFKVGKSYYNSSEFERLRIKLRKSAKAHADFAPVSEFGIGFLASFMLGDRVEVETRLRTDFPDRDCDSRPLRLRIDGPTRLIHMDDVGDDATIPKGTTVSVHLSRQISVERTSGPDFKGTPTHEIVLAYIQQVCQDLPYPIDVVHQRATGESRERILPQGIAIKKPEWYEGETYTMNIMVPDVLEANVLFLSPADCKKSLAAYNSPLREGPRVEDEAALMLPSALLRAGFRVHTAFVSEYMSFESCPHITRLRCLPQAAKRRMALPNVARSGMADQSMLHRALRWEAAKKWWDDDATMPFAIAHEFQVSDEEVVSALIKKHGPAAVLAHIRPHWVDWCAKYDFFREHAPSGVSIVHDEDGFDLWSMGQPNWWIAVPDYSCLWARLAGFFVLETDREVGRLVIPSVIDRSRRLLAYSIASSKKAASVEPSDIVRFCPFFAAQSADADVLLIAQITHGPLGQSRWFNIQKRALIDQVGASDTSLAALVKLADGQSPYLPQAAWHALSESLGTERLVKPFGDVVTVNDLLREHGVLE